MNTPTRILVRLLGATAAAWSIALAPAFAAAELPTQTSAVSGVTVKVTPRTIAADATIWVFAVVLETHSQDLVDDLARSAVLVTDDGRRIQPVAWKGPPTGGHHREGTLEFPAVKPAPHHIDLVLGRAGEAQPRTFRWFF